MMNPQLKKLIIGVIVLILLVCCYFAGKIIKKSAAGDEDSQQEQTEDTQESQDYENDLIALSSDDNKISGAVVTRLEEDGSQSVIELVKSGDSWVLKGHEGVIYSESNIGALATSLEVLPYSEKICDLSENPVEADGDLLKEYGLDSPVTTAVSTFEDGSSAVIYVGGSTPDKEYSYVRVEGGDGIYLVESYYTNRYRYNLDSLISKEMPSINAQKILTVNILQKGKEEIDIEYDEDLGSNNSDLAEYGMQTLTMKKPLSGASVYPPNLQESLLSTTSSLALGELAEAECYDLSEYGLDDESAYIKIYLKDMDNELGLVIGSSADDDNYYCALGERDDDVKVKLSSGCSVFKIAKSSIEPFENANIIDFIEKFLALVKRIDAEEVEFKGLDKEYRLTFKDNPDKEKATDDDDTRTGILNDIELDDDSFADLYQAFIGLTFDSLSNTEKPSGDPTVTIKYTLTDGSIKEIKFYEYNANNNFYIAEIDGDTSRIVHKQGIKNIINIADGLMK